MPLALLNLPSAALSSSSPVAVPRTGRPMVAVMGSILARSIFSSWSSTVPLPPTGTVPVTSPPKTLAQKSTRTLPMRSGKTRTRAWASSTVITVSFGALSSAPFASSGDGGRMRRAPWTSTPVNQYESTVSISSRCPLGVPFLLWARSNSAMSRSLSRSNGKVRYPKSARQKR